MPSKFPLELFEFTYVMHPPGGTRRIMFCWVGRDEEDANEAFWDALGLHPYEVNGLKLETKLLKKWRFA